MLELAFSGAGRRSFQGYSAYAGDCLPARLLACLPTPSVSCFAAHKHLPFAAWSPHLPCSLPPGQPLQVKQLMAPQESVEEAVARVRRQVGGGGDDSGEWDSARCGGTESVLCAIL